MNAPELHTLRQTRFIRAPREKVFGAFVDPAQLKAWHCPRGMHVVHAECDARVGGRWELHMQARDGTRMRVGGVYRDVVRPQRLAYTWQWLEGVTMPEMQTLVEVDLSERAGGTELTLVHSGFPAPIARDMHAQGWATTLNHLLDVIDERGTAATLTLFGDARSTYTRTVRMALAEKGIAHAFESCAPRTPQILTLHPFGRIPALRDGENALWETSAIVRWLDECFDGTPLVPGTPSARARSEQWVSAVNAYLYDTMVRRYVLQHIFPRGEGGRPDRGVIDAALGEMPAQLAALDAAYGSADFVAGTALSMADLFIAPILAYVEAMPEGAALLAAAPNVRRAQAALRARASFVDTAPQP